MNAATPNENEEIKAIGAPPKTNGIDHDESARTLPDESYCEATPRPVMSPAPIPSGVGAHSQRGFAQRDAAGVASVVGARAPAAEAVPDAAREATRRAQLAGVAAHGLTNWPTGCATDAAQACFNLWLDGFGKEGNKEDRQVVEALRTFIDQYGSSRFEPLSSRPDVRVQKRAGFYRPAPQPPDDDDDDGLNEGVACSDHLDDGREYLVLPDVFRSEICDGRDWKSAVRVLIGLGVIVPGTDRKATQKPRIPQLGSTRRLYVVSSTKLFEDH